MKHLNEEQVEALKLSIRTSVRESIDNMVDNICNEAAEEEEEEDVEELDEEEQESEEDSEDSDEELDEEEQESEDEEDKQVDESDFFESFDVTATVKGSRGNKTEQFTVSRMTELKRKAQTGKYEHLTVRKRNGSEVEYSIENGKMVQL